MFGHVSRRHRWCTVWTCLVVLTALLPIGCGREGGEAPAPDVVPQRGGVAVLGSITDIDSWNEYLSRQTLGNYVLRRIYLRLAHEQGDEAQGSASDTPGLAESWEASADGKSLTFRLRETVWSDGTPITADDVRFTWQAQTSPEVPWANAQIKDRITDVEVVDPRTVTFHFDGRYPDQFTDAVDGGILPRHVFGQVPFAEWATHDWSQYSIGSGPFLPERHQPGHEIVLRRNPSYFDPEHPIVDQVVIRIVPDVLNLLTQLKSGEIDFLLGVPPRDASRIATDNTSSVQVIPFKLPHYEYLGWNCARPPFDNPMLRRAITLAIDREALVEDLVYGYGRIGYLPVPSDWWGAARDVSPWSYDPEQARGILRELGYATVSADGTAAARGGRVLEFELITNTGNRLREEALVKIQEQLLRIGVKVSIRLMEQRALIQTASRGEYDGYLGGWSFVGKIPLAALFGSASVPPEGFNVVRYDSAAVDTDLEALAHAADRSAMRPLLTSIQHRIHEDQPYTFLFERDGLAAYGPRLRDVQIDVPEDPLAGLERFWVATR